jgi:hypothetical protein
MANINSPKVDFNLLRLRTNYGTYEYDNNNIS